MFCEKCGIEMQEGRFCSNCGSSLIDEKNHEAAGNTKSNSPNRSLKNKLIAIVASAVLGILVSAGILFAIFVLPDMEINAFKSQIQNREYRDSYLTYEEFDPEDRTKANKWMREYIGAVENDYYAGKLDYSTATGILEELMQFEAAYNEANKAGENVYLDNQSAIAFDKAKGYAAEEKWQEAYEELENVHIKYRLYDEVSTLRSECVTNVRADALEQINAFAASSEIDKLIAARDLALMVLPDDKEIIQAAQTHLDAFVTKTLTDAKTLAESKDLAGAMDLLQYAVSMYEHPDFWSALDGYSYDLAEAHCEALVAQNDLLGAVEYAKGLYDADIKYSALLEKYAGTVVEQTLEKAKTHADIRQFAEAIALISSVQAVYDHADLQAAYENYSAYLPCKLSECHQIDCSYRNRIDKNDHFVDSFGKKHEDAIRFTSFGHSPTYAVYSLEGKYVTLSGTLVAEKDHEGSVSIKIYVDDELIYESTGIARTTETITFNMDVTGCKQLRIEAIQAHAGWGYIIVDAMVS